MPLQSRRLTFHPFLLPWLCIVAWLSGQWIWHFWPNPEVTSAELPLRVLDAGRLAAASLFQGSGKSDDNAVGSSRLIGINTDSRTGFALIADESGVSRAYQLGAALPDGSQLIRLEPDNVLLQRQGVQQRLRMHKVLQP